MNVQNDPFSMSIFQRKLINRRKRWMTFFTYFTWMHMFFKSILIFKPKQGSVKLVHNDSWTKVEYEERTFLKQNKANLCKN